VVLELASRVEVSRWDNRVDGTITVGERVSAYRTASRTRSRNAGSSRSQGIPAICWAIWARRVCAAEFTPCRFLCDSSYAMMARISAIGEFLDRSHRLARVEVIAIGDGQFIGFEHTCGGAQRMQHLGCLIGAFFASDFLSRLQRGIARSRPRADHNTGTLTSFTAAPVAASALNVTINDLLAPLMTGIRTADNDLRPIELRETISRPHKYSAR
jgi:hypothetical protein